MKKAHKSKSRVIKQASVDSVISPIVDWLNSFEGIYTRWSCQGEYDKKGQPIERAYIIFHCEDTLDLITVCIRTKNLAEIKIEAYNGSLRYWMQFPDKTSLDTAKNCIKKKWWT